MLYRTLAACLLFFTGSLHIQSQTAIPNAPVQAPTKKSQRSYKQPNVKFGEIVSIDMNKLELTLKEKNDVHNTYALTDATQWLKNRKTAASDAFKTGDSVVIHLRKIRGVNAQSVAEAADSASWKWLTTVRKETSKGILKTLSEDSLETMLAPDSTPFTFTISAKTQYIREGKAASAASFKPEEQIFIIPRSLPSGKVMARGVADTEADAVLLSERLKSTLSGTLQSIDSSKHTLILTTAAGDHRMLSFPENVNVWIGSKAAKISDLQPGMHLKIRMHGDSTGEELITEIKKDDKSSIHRIRTAKKSLK